MKIVYQDYDSVFFEGPRRPKSGVWRRRRAAKRERRLKKFMDEYYHSHVRNITQTFPAPLIAKLRTAWDAMHRIDAANAQTFDYKSIYPKTP